MKSTTCVQRVVRREAGNPLRQQSHASIRAAVDCHTPRPLTTLLWLPQHPPASPAPVHCLVFVNRRRTLLPPCPSPSHVWIARNDERSPARQPADSAQAPLYLSRLRYCCFTCSTRGRHRGRSVIPTVHPPKQHIGKNGGRGGLHLDICQSFLGIVHSRTRCVQTYRYCFRCKEIGTAPRNGQCMPA